MSISRILYSGYYEYFKNINSGYYEWLSGARENVSSAESALLREWCMRVVHESGAWGWCTRVMHESTWVVQRVRCYVSGAWEWCMRVVHESGAREWCTRIVHKITWVVHESSWVVHEITWVRKLCTRKMLVDWGWVLQGKQAVDWTWVLQKKL